MAGRTMTAPRSPSMFEPAPRVTEERPPPEATFTAMRDELRARAGKLVLSADVLEGWYVAQLAFAREKRAKRKAAQATNLERLTGPADEHWRAWYEGEARLCYWDDAVSRLEGAGHVLCCEDHGLEGVELGTVDVVALAARGLLTGIEGDRWGRRCSECWPISEWAELAYRDHLAATRGTKAESASRTARIRAEGARR